MKRGVGKQRQTNGSWPVPFRCSDRLLHSFQVSTEGLAGALVRGFLFLVAMHEWISRRFG